MKYNKKVNKKKYGMGEMVSGASSLANLVPGVGTAIGAVGGLLGNVIGAGEQKRAQAALLKQQTIANNEAYNNQFKSQLDTNNANPYGNQLFALGGPILPDDPTKPKVKLKPRPYQPNITLPNWDGLVEKADGSIGMWGNDWPAPKVVSPKPEIPMGNIDHLGRQSGQKFQGTPVVRDKIFEMEKRLKAQSNMKGYALGAEVQENIINIEKGELQIDPQTGKILREYKGINPETGGLYESHNKKGKDTTHNMVNAIPGTFIITKAKANQYKKAVDNNDKIAKETILQNIRNKKKSESKYEGGDFVLDANDYKLMSAAEAPFNFNPDPIANVKVGNKALGSILGLASQLAPGIGNMIQGAKAPNYSDRVTPIVNPMKNRVLNNLQEEVSLEPIKNEIFRQQKSIFNQIDNTTSSNAVARANKNNVFGNTTNQIGKLAIEQKMANNQTKGRNNEILNRIGVQDMQSQGEARNYNYQIDNTNDMKDLAKQQQRNLGISQLQELYLNNKKNKQLSKMDEKRIEALKMIFPRLSQEEYAELLKMND